MFFNDGEKNMKRSFCRSVRFVFFGFGAMRVVGTTMTVPMAIIAPAMCIIARDDSYYSYGYGSYSGCFYDADCADGYYCAGDGYCYQSENWYSDTTCYDDFDCLNGTYPWKAVALNIAETKNDCPHGYFCYSDGTCG